MTLLDDVKLLTTANSYKAGTLYSIKPDNGNGDLDITRSTTATRVNPSGLIETVAINEPQIDYSDGCGCLWVEPVSTNLFTYSTGLPSGGWAGTATYNANSVVGPDGTTTGNLIEDPSGGMSVAAYNIMSVSASTTYTFSFYAKRGTMTDMKYSILDMQIFSYIVMPTSFYSQTNSSTWSRISVTFTTNSGTSSVRIYLGDFAGGTGTNFSLWGVQLEQHTADINMETSYIPTAGATVTRNPTVFDKTGLTSTIGSIEGVLFAEIAVFWNGTGSPTSGQKMMGWKSGVGRAILGTWGTSWFAWLAGNGGNRIFTMSPAITETSFVKMAIKYKQGDHAYWKDGVEITASTHANIVEPSQDRIVSSYDGISNFWEFYGKIRSIQVYDTALTDAQLLALTT